jgi:hypothetical protein
VALGLFLIGASAWAQASPLNDDKVIDVILAQKSITFGNAAWLVGRSIGTFDDTVTPVQAAELASKAGWNPAKLEIDSPLDLQSYGLILVKAVGIPGGVLYGWFPTPRYALRELTFRKIVPPTLAPDDIVSGEEAMRYLQAAQDWKAGKS